jgi:hypothetical protein
MATPSVPFAIAHDLRKLQLLELPPDLLALLDAPSASPRCAPCSLPAIHCPCPLPMASPAAASRL